MALILEIKIEKAREKLANMLVVELAKKEWGAPECQEAIKKEIDNMKNKSVGNLGPAVTTSFCIILEIFVAIKEH